MENLTPLQIAAVIVGVLLGAAGFINTVGSAIERCVKAYKAAKAPEVKQDDKIAELERRVGDLEIWSKRDNDAIEESRNSTRVLTQGMLALLDHALNGNNIDQMKDAQKCLNAYLINH